MTRGKARIIVRDQISSASNLLSCFWLGQQVYEASFSLLVLGCFEKEEVDC